MIAYENLNAGPDVVALCDQCGRAIRRSRSDHEEGFFFGYGERIVPLHLSRCADRYEAAHGQGDGEYTLETFLQLLAEGLGLASTDSLAATGTPSRSGGSNALANGGHGRQALARRLHLRLVEEPPR